MEMTIQFNKKSYFEIGKKQYILGTPRETRVITVDISSLGRMPTPVAFNAHGARFMYLLRNYKVYKVVGQEVSSHLLF